MVTFEHLEKTETISADGDESEIHWDDPLMMDHKTANLAQSQGSKHQLWNKRFFGINDQPTTGEKISSCP